MPTLTLHPLTELLRMFRGRRRELQCPKHIEEDLVIDAYEQVGHEAIERTLAAAAKSHEAEVCIGESVNGVDAAMLPESEGGTAITPTEVCMFGIRTHLV